MARRRLNPAQLSAPEAKSLPLAARERALPPAARLAAEAASASAAALAEARKLAEAEAEGRVLIDIPLDAIEAGHLARDRLDGAVPDEDEAALIASIRAHGQRAPAEVVALEDGRWGLISGWRRLSALRALHQETGEARFSVLRAIPRGRDSAGRADPEAYLAMVEENEIRAGLSPYERGRIAVLAAGQGAFPSVSEAVNGLFGAASKAKRAKIRRFAELHEALGPDLRHPQAIPERLGLRLAEGLKAFEGAEEALRRALRAAPEGRSAEAERAWLEDMVEALTPRSASRRAGVSHAKPAGRPPSRREPLAEGLFLVETAGPKGVVFRLEGPRAADPEVLERARALLRRLSEA
jgi:ParB family chromosome partitioning protein